MSNKRQNPGWEGFKHTLIEAECNQLTNEVSVPERKVWK